MSFPLYEIRLIVDRRDDGYQAVWTSPRGLSAPFPLTLPLAPEQAAELRWYLETYIQLPGAGDHVRAQALEARLVDWGKALFDAFFGTAEGTQVYNNLMTAKAPRLVTLGSSDPAVLAQPWELMRGSARKGQSAGVSGGHYPPSASGGEAGGTGTACAGITFAGTVDCQPPDGYRLY